MEPGQEPLHGEASVSVTVLEVLDAAMETEPPWRALGQEF
jgi:hypothetical protein